MRVLLTLASSSVTGPAERMLGDARVLREAGHGVTVAFDTRRPGTMREACRAQQMAVAEELRLSRVSGVWESLRDIFALRRRIASGVDLVHAHFSHDHHLALLAARGLRDRVRIVRSLESNATGSRWGIRGTDGLEVPSASVAASPRWDAIRERLTVLPSAVDPDRFSPRASTKLREAIRVPLGAPLIGIVARVKPERRHAELLEAFARASPAVAAAYLAVIGRGEGIPGLQTQAHRLGLGERVRFAGYWAGDDLVEAYRGLDVAVWLANGNDGGARGVLEAMAVGLPVVAYRAPPMDEQLADGAGALVPAGDVGALAATLAALASDAGLRAEIGARARARVLASYTWAQRGPALLAFYARVRGQPAVR